MCRSTRRAPGCARASRCRRNPAWPGNPGPLRLDGEMIELESVRLDGRQLGPREYQLSDKELVIGAPPAAPLHAGDRHLLQPRGQQGADRPLPLARHLLHAVRGPGLPPHHLLPRPPRRARHLHHPHRGRPRARPRCCSPTATRSSAARSRAASGTTRCGAIPHPKPCYLFALVGGNLASYASDFTTASGRKVDLRIYVEPGKESRCAWAMDALKRSMRWDEERFGREYDLDVFNIVAVSDFNMGAMENKGLNIFNDGLILASPETATDASFRRHRAGDRARVLPQLDRQPHHLPRLVPALPQGRPDRLPRPGVLRRPALGHGRAHPRRAQPEGGAVPGGRGPAGPSRAPRPLHRDQQLLHGDRLQQGRRAGAHAPDAAGARGLPQGHGPLLRAP